MTKTREPYTAAELLECNKPNYWAVMKRAEPGARLFNGELLARCKDEATARQIADALNAAAAETKDAPLVKFMLTDKTLDWVQYQADVKEGRQAFRDFHGRALARGGR